MKNRQARMGRWCCLGAAFFLGMSGAEPLLFAQGTTQVDVIIVSNRLEQTAGGSTNYFLGKLGIGTNTAACALHMRQGANGDIIRVDTLYTANQFRVYMGTPGRIYLQTTDTAGGVKIFLSPVGTSYFDGSKLGVGVASAGGKLHVKSDGASTYPIYVTGTNNQPLSLLYQNASGNGEFWLCNASGQGRVVISSSGDSYFLGGDIGIGTNSPGESLHTTGKGRFDQGISYVYPLGDLSMGVYTNMP